MQESNSENGECTRIVANDVQKTLPKEPLKIKVIELKEELALKNTELMIMKQKLELRTEEATELKEKLTKAQLLLASKSSSLENLEGENKNLREENEQLDSENDQIAVNNLALEKECTRLNSLLKKFSVDQEIQSISPSKEKDFKSNILNNMPEFEKYTDIRSLASFLYKYHLLTFDDYADIQVKSTDRERAMYFYTQILPRKGGKAHIMFYQCLKEAVGDPSCHSGHNDLLRLFDID